MPPRDGYKPLLGKRHADHGVPGADNLLGGHALLPEYSLGDRGSLFVPGLAGDPREQLVRPNLERLNAYANPASFTGVSAGA